LVDAAKTIDLQKVYSEKLGHLNKDGTLWIKSLKDAQLSYNIEAKGSCGKTGGQAYLGEIDDIGMKEWEYAIYDVTALCAVHEAMTKLENKPTATACRVISEHEVFQMSSLAYEDLMAKFGQLERCGFRESSRVDCFFSNKGAA
jgi:hypothetical protein